MLEFEKGKLMGLGCFASEIIHIISLGESESYLIIEAHLESNDLIEYISQKYGKFFNYIFNDTIYDNKELNKFFSMYYDEIKGKGGKQNGIMKDEDGLLLILALIANKVESDCRS